jgi:virginiamycin B lyase
MPTRLTSRLLAIAFVLQAAILFSARDEAKAAEITTAALVGHVSSQEEGAMEGVIVSAKRTGAAMRFSVATDAKGMYSFPRTKLEPGEYTVTMRAIGYEIDPAKVQVPAQGTATADLKVQKTKDLAAQLTNAEWLMSMPDDDRKTTFMGCTMCHTLQRPIYSKYNVDELSQIVRRMTTYYIGTSPALRQFVPEFVQRAGPPEHYRIMADYISTINLSKGDKWPYELKTLPRPTGRSTRMIVTEYDLASPLAQPHDVMLGSDGNAWYMDFDRLFLTKMDPKTGHVTEYPVPVVKPSEPKGGLGIDEDKDGNIWVALQFQAAVAKFNRKTEKFQMYPLPKELDKNPSQLSMLSAAYSNVDGKVWIKDSAGLIQFRRLDVNTGKWDAAPPIMKGHSSYGIVSGPLNDLYFMELGNEYIGRVDPKTMEIKYYKTPTKNSGPRRGHTDAQDRLWFGEFRGNNVAMFDPKTEKITEWPLPTPYSGSYEVMLDKNGEAWTGGMTNDRISRVDTKTGQVTDYLMPIETNIRHMYVDNSTNPVTIWVGNDHHASIVKLEPLD